MLKAARMNRSLALTNATYRLLFAAICFAVIFFSILPNQLGTSRFPWPDVLYLLAASWVLRRPEYAPFWLIAAAALLMDAFFLRPMGLWAALMVLGTEFLRRREEPSRDLPFLIEWATVSATLLAMIIISRALYTMLLIDRAPIGLTLLGLLVSIVSYPLFVFINRYVFGIRKITAREAEELRVQH